MSVEELVHVPTFRRMLQLRIQEDVQPGEGNPLILEVKSYDKEGLVLLFYAEVQGPVREEGKYGSRIINLHIHPDFTDLYITMAESKKPEALWNSKIEMRDRYGVQYLDITMNGAYKYPPFPRGAPSILFQSPSEKVKP